MRITHLSKHPFLVEAVDEKDRGLCESHEEVTNRQVHDEVIRQVTKFLVATDMQTQMDRVRDVRLIRSILYSSLQLQS